MYLFFLKVTLITYAAPPKFCPNITLSVMVYHLWRSVVSFPLSRMTRLGILGIYSVPCEGCQVHTEQNGWTLKLSWKRIIGTSTLDNQTDWQWKSYSFNWEHHIKINNTKIFSMNRIMRQATDGIIWNKPWKILTPWNGGSLPMTQNSAFSPLQGQLHTRSFT